MADALAQWCFIDTTVGSTQMVCKCCTAREAVLGSIQMDVIVFMMNNFRERHSECLNRRLANDSALALGATGNMPPLMP